MRKRFITALLVEDDEQILRRVNWLVTGLFNRQVQTLQAASFKEAREIIKHGHFDMSIIDIGLPDGNGADLIAEIKSVSPNHPIIVLTAFEKVEFQLRFYKSYERIHYVPKSTLEELEDSLLWARDEAAGTLAHLIGIPVGKQNIELIRIEEVCYVMPIPESNHLHVELYDFETKKYHSKEIKSMALNKFMDKYNEMGYFLRCHASYIVNRRMIKSVSKPDNEITLLFPRESGNDVTLTISEKYRKEVLAQLGGVC